MITIMERIEAMCCFLILKLKGFDICLTINFGCPHKGRRLSGY